MSTTTPLRNSSSRRDHSRVTATTGANRSARVVQLLGLVVVLVYLIPVYWMVSTSLKRSSDVFAVPPSLWPDPATTQAYQDAVLGNAAVLQGIRSSLIITVPTLTLTLALAVPAAYGLARLRTRITGAVLLLMLLAQMLPTISLALPLFGIFSEWGLVDTYTGLIIANTSLALPFAIIMLRPYMLAIPQDLIDAGLIDGCTGFRAFRSIGVPLVRPGLIMVATLTFVSTWGEFVFGLTLATSDDTQPITVVLNRFIAQFGTQWTNLMAVSTVIAAPIILAFILLQRYVVAGISDGAIKD
jgi:multiple sugar transport system permease protein